MDDHPHVLSSILGVFGDGSLDLFERGTLLQFGVAPNLNFQGLGFAVFIVAWGIEGEVLRLAGLVFGFEFANVAASADDLGLGVQDFRAAYF